jgi:hypothetical protein
MRTVFADTFYFLALLDSREKRHRRAISGSWSAGLLPTSSWRGR